jgi:predicted nucleotidyltransferase
MELAAAAAAADPRILRIVLFGSLAIDRATPRSDADLMIELSDHSEPRSMDRIPEYLQAFSKGPVPVDVFPFTVSEISSRKLAGDRFMATIQSEGLEIFRRGPQASNPAPHSSGSSPTS